MTKRLTRYEFEDRILKSLRKRSGVATAGDVAADTGLPLDEVELAMREMLSHYKSHLDVDDDGHLLYRFDPGLKRRGEQPGRRWYEIKKKAWTAFQLFFKVWIMVTLVGYTLLFVVLLIAAGIAGLAASASTGSDSDSGGGRVFLFPFYLLARLLELVFWISLFDTSGGRGRGYGGYGRAYGRGYAGARQRKKVDKPIYQRIFDYVFGPQLTVDPLAGERAFAQFIRARKGRVTAADWASRTGQSLAEADSALTAGVMRFRGEIDVTEEGTLVYKFDELRVQAALGDESTSARDLPPIWERDVKLPAFTGNKGSTNTWITVFNSFNLVMASFVLASAAQLTSGVIIGLGIVPLVFSVLFFGIPILRRISYNGMKKRAEKENLRRRQLQAVYLSASDGEPKPVDEEVFDRKQSSRILSDFDGDIEVSDDGRTLYVFPRVALELEAARRARQSAEEQVVFGQTIFSSDEEQFSLEEADLAEFDRRLSVDLGGEQVFDFAPVSMGATVAQYQ
jgi:hypothetical protein